MNCSNRLGLAMLKGYHQETASAEQENLKNRAFQLPHGFLEMSKYYFEMVYQ